MTYRVKGYDFVDPFDAPTEKKAAEHALKVLGFSFGAREQIKKNGPSATLKNLGYELVETRNEV